MHYAPSLDEAMTLPLLELASLAWKFPFDRVATQPKAKALKAQGRQKEEVFNSTANTVEKQIEAKERGLLNLQQSLDYPPALRRRSQRRQCPSSTCAEYFGNRSTGGSR
jgi:hypothetical protein